MSSQAFRKDINGLRAWAVVSVTLYHFGVAGFQGGFVGVDLFFVISGFLMTGLIVRGLERAQLAGTTYSVTEFYLARARRILPALIALVGVLLVLGWFLLPSKAYEAQATHGVAALLFISNIKFWMEAGYFDAASHEKLLLHTWSLSIEWQFYLILPLLLMLAWRLKPSRSSVLAVCLGLFIASFLLSALYTLEQRSAAFYLLHFRAWELLAGGLVFFLCDRWRPSTGVSLRFEGLGFVLILLSIALYDKNTAWPSWQALLPVLGTCLVIAAQRGNSLLTGNRCAQFLGDSSYSIYLWHWPLCVALVYLDWLDRTEAVAVALALTLALGWLSYRYIEQTTRRGLVSMKPIYNYALLGTLCLGLMIPSALIRTSEGVPGRLPQQIDQLFAEANNINPLRAQCHVDNDTPVPECRYGGDQLGAVVIGDSHAAAVIRGVERAMADSSKHILDWTLSSCPTIRGIKDQGNADYQCGAFVDELIESKIADLPREVPILIVNRLSLVLQGPNEDDPNFNYFKEKPYKYIDAPYGQWSDAFVEEITQGFVETTCALAQHNPVYLLQPIPEMVVNVPSTLGRRALVGNNERLAVPVSEYQQRQHEALAAQQRAAERCGVTLLDPRPLLCDEQFCYADYQGEALYYDDDHLSERGADHLQPLFKQIFGNDREITELAEYRANESDSESL